MHVRQRCAILADGGSHLVSSHLISLTAPELLQLCPADGGQGLPEGYPKPLLAKTQP